MRRRIRFLAIFYSVFTVCVMGYGSRAMAQSYVSYGPVALWDSSYSDANGWNTSASYWQTIQYADLNGDGKADVCGRGGDGLVCALSTGTGFGTPTLWNSDYSDANGWKTSSAYWRTIRYADLNGDKKADVCGRGGGGLMCALSTGGKFGASTLWNSDYSDANGWNSSASYWQTIQYADLNGDGKADVCGRGGDGIWCALSTGGGFGASTLWNSDYSDANGWKISASYWQTIRFIHIDSDRKADVCGRGGDGIWCAHSRGTSFEPSYLKFSNYSDANGWGSDPSYWQTIQYADLNKDGMADVCGRGGDGLWCSESRLVIIK
jgi:FG-GAP-like repeat